MKPEPWTHHDATVNDVRLHYVESGPANGPLVLLLHGFPEFWYSWRRQIPALAEAGFRVVAADMRGYDRSERPRGVKAYCLENLVADAVGLIRHAGAEKAVVAGHDWGGIVAWHAAMWYPQAVEKLIVLNAPHPEAYRRELRHLDQLQRSWYAFFFQLPRLPEALLRARNFAALDVLFRRDPVNPQAFSDEDVQRYKDALAHPGALTAAINYYRALFRRGGFRPKDTRRIDMPTLLIWGEQDRALIPRLADGLEAWVPNVRVERIPESSHWVQNDAPDTVNMLMLDFLRR